MWSAVAHPEEKPTPLHKRKDMKRYKQKQMKKKNKSNRQMQKENYEKT